MVDTPETAPHLHSQVATTLIVVKVIDIMLLLLRIISPMPLLFPPSRLRFLRLRPLDTIKWIQILLNVNTVHLKLELVFLLSF